jgi:hypothetical protein
MRTEAPRTAQSSLDTAPTLTSATATVILAPLLRNLFCGLPGHEKEEGTPLTQYERYVALRCELLMRAARAHAVAFASARPAVGRREATPEGASTFDALVEHAAALHSGVLPTVDSLNNFLVKVGDAINMFPHSSHGSMSVPNALRVLPGVAEPLPHTLGALLSLHEQDLGEHCSRRLFGPGGILSSANTTTVAAQGALSVLLLRLLTSLAYSELPHFDATALLLDTARASGLALPIVHGRQRAELSRDLSSLSTAMQAVERHAPLEVTINWRALLGQPPDHPWCVFGAVLLQRFAPILTEYSNSPATSVINTILGNVTRADRQNRQEAREVGLPEVALPGSRGRQPPAAAAASSAAAAAASAPRPRSSSATRPAAAAAASSAPSSASRASSSERASRRLCPNCKLPSCGGPSVCEGECHWDLCPLPTPEARASPHTRGSHGNTPGRAVSPASLRAGRSPTPGHGAAAATPPSQRVSFTSTGCRNCGGTHRSHECPAQCDWPGCPLRGTGPGGSNPLHSRASHGHRSSSTGSQAGSQGAGRQYGARSATYIDAGARSLVVAPEASLGLSLDAMQPATPARASTPSPPKQQHYNYSGADASAPHSAGSMPALSTPAPHPYARDASGVPLSVNDSICLQTNVGNALCDSGSTLSLVALEALVGLHVEIVQLPEHERVHIGGALAGSGGSVTTATFTLTVDASTQDARGLAAGTPPLSKPYGGLFTFLVFPQALLAPFATSSFTPVCVLGLDAHSAPCFSALFGLLHRNLLPRSAPEYVSVWSHAQARAPPVLPRRGTAAQFTSHGADMVHAVPGDHAGGVDEDDWADCPNPSYSIFGRDGEREDTFYSFDTPSVATLGSLPPPLSPPAPPASPPQAAARAASTIHYCDDTLHFNDDGSVSRWEAHTPTPPHGASGSTPPPRGVVVTPDAHVPGGSDGDMPALTRLYAAAAPAPAAPAAPQAALPCAPPAPPSTRPPPPPPPPPPKPAPPARRCWSCPCCQKSERMSAKRNATPAPTRPRRARQSPRRAGQRTR